MNVKHGNMFGHLISRMINASSSREKGRVVQTALRQHFLGRISSFQFAEICNFYDNFVNSQHGVSTLAAYDTFWRSCRE